MTEPNLAASSNLNNDQCQQVDASNEISSTSTQVSTNVFSSSSSIETIIILIFVQLASSLSLSGSASSNLIHSSDNSSWSPTSAWLQSWKGKLPLQTIMRLLQVLVPQVEKICMDRGLTDEREIIKFLQHGTLVGLLPVPHPILIRKYQPNSGTIMWFRTYMWGIIYLK